MAEYIERQKVIDITAETGALETQRRVQEIPAADVVEVVHGKWIHDENYVDWAEQYKCSVCNGHALTDGDYRHKLSNYCPNCGAKMDLEESK